MRRIYLSRNHKKLLGVCGGIAEAFDADPVFIRLIWLAATVFTGFVPGIITYFLAAWLVIPKGPET
jgi:phage shock protein C